MANQEQLALLRQGVDAWNTWREQHPDVQPDLSAANLSRMDLSEANLSDTDLSKANLKRADLWGADLQDTDLTEVIGLSAEQLAGTNLSGAKLPEALLKFEGLAVVEETSKNIQQFFISMLAGCVYSILTIATTTHTRLLTNSASSPLPIIGTVIPIVGFYLAVPCLLLGVQIYLQLYLQRMWERLADLPAIFPNEKPLDERAYAGPLTSFVRSHFILLNKDLPPLSYLQSWTFIIVTWGVVPFTLLLFWLNYLPRRDWVGTALHIALLAVSIGFGVLSYRFAAVTLHGEELQSRYSMAGLVTAGSIGLLFLFLSLGAIDGVLLGHPSQLWSQAANHNTTATEPWGVRMFALFGCCSANLEEEYVSTKPSSWAVEKETEKDMAQQIELVQGARLRGNDLRWAKARRSFLAKADLRQANLEGADLFIAQIQGANLSGANLRGANLSSAYLQRSDLSGADLRGANLQEALLHHRANLSGANLQGADLSKAWLKGANLSQANLQGAILSQAALPEVKLRGADLRQADLSEADLQKADLAKADLQGATGLTAAQVKAAANWELAFYSTDVLLALGLPIDHNETLLAKFEKEKRSHTPAGDVHIGSS